MKAQICLKKKKKNKTDKTQAYTKTLPLTDAGKRVTGAMCVCACLCVEIDILPGKF